GIPDWSRGLARKIDRIGLGSFDDRVGEDLDRDGLLRRAAAGKRQNRAERVEIRAAGGIGILGLVADTRRYRDRRALARRQAAAGVEHRVIGGRALIALGDRLLAELLD